MSDAALSPEFVVHALRRIPGWSGDTTALSRTWCFPDFISAIGFMQACVPGIVAKDHHPEWTNAFDRVSVRLRTHDAGDRVTAADIDLAHHFDAVAAQWGGL